MTEELKAFEELNNQFAKEHGCLPPREYCYREGFQAGQRHLPKEVEAVVEAMKAIQTLSSGVGAMVRHDYGSAPIPRHVIQLVERFEGVRLLALNALKEVK